MFDEIYLSTYSIGLADRDSPAEAEAAAAFAGVQPPAEILDAPPDSADTPFPSPSSASTSPASTGRTSSSLRRDESPARSSGRSGYRPTSASCRSRTRVSTPCSASHLDRLPRRGGRPSGLRSSRGPAPTRLARDRDPPPRPADGDLPAARLGSARGRRRPARGARLRLRRRRGRDESHLPLGRRTAERDVPRAATRRPSW